MKNPRRQSRRRSRRRRLFAGLLAALLVPLLLGGCIGASAPPPIRDFADRQLVLQEALGEIGRPYHYGGADADGFDCSGLVRYVYQSAGLNLPRTAAEQSSIGRHIPFEDAAPGDLVFYRIDGRPHVTIYVGDGRVVHAPATGQTVTVISANTSYWRSHLVATVRILP